MASSRGHSAFKDDDNSAEKAHKSFTITSQTDLASSQVIDEYLDDPNKIRHSEANYDLIKLGSEDCFAGS